MPQDIVGLLRQALHAEEEDEHINALRYASEALRKDPCHVSARLHVALNLAAIARDEADTRYGWQRAESALEALRAVTELLRRQGADLAAIAAASNALSLEPQDEETLRTLELLHQDIFGRHRDTTLPERRAKSAPLLDARADHFADMSMLDLDDDDELIEHAVELVTTGPAEQEAFEHSGIRLLSALPFDLFLVMVRELRCRRFAPNAKLIRQGGQESSVFLLVEGRVRVSRKLADRELTLALLGEGAMFGEMSWVNSRPRTATVVAAGPVLVLEITGDHVTAAARRRQKVIEELTRFASERMVANLLISSPLFAAFNADERRTLLGAFTAHDVPAGERFIHEDAEATGLYLIAKGRVRVSKSVAAGREVLIAEIGDGELLGEIALINKRRTTASATALEPSRLLHLDALRFEEVVRQRPEIGTHLRSLSRERLDSMSETLVSSAAELSTDEIVML